MDITATAPQPLAQSEARLRASGRRALLWPKPGVRARQIALITLLVAIVVAITTVANIANMTGVIISRTEGETRQFLKQALYAISLELAHNNAVDRLQNPYEAIMSEHSGIRGLIESPVAVSGPIAYVYVTGVDGEIIVDRDGRKLASNLPMITATTYNLTELSKQNAYMQLGRLLFGGPVFDLESDLTTDNSVPGKLHIGVFTSSIRGELWSPITTNLLIGLIAVVGAAIVASSSANLLLKPLEAISSSIDLLGRGEDEAKIGAAKLPHDEVVSSVTARLKQLGERMAGDRSELEIMRGRLRQVVSHLEERLLLVNRDGRVILASPGAEELAGAKERELTGLPVDETLGHSHPLVELIERSLMERRSVARTILHINANSRPRQLLVSIQFLEDAGETVGALVSLRDYESFQKFESQWDLSKKLADLGRITSGIAHEVKNPLNAMVIHLEILRAKLETPGSNPAPQIEILDSEIKRLDRVVQTFLNFTRPVELKLEPLDLNSLVSQVVALAFTDAVDHGVSITKNLVEGPLIIKGDSDLLKQGLLNIIINGCQAMPDGGSLVITTTRGEDGSALIRVSDEGVGIPPESRDQIFNLYYTTRKNGTGIGLAQAFRAVQIHNGKIQFDSAPGMGTTFEISLPGAG
ncbi:MAG: hypothetical protein DMF61_12820 [Blastocatellia bacterium AA13]|nr:MAG: hypothetical protein DMF61_12820 [Blastocatellia bacterium AA13]